MHVDITWKFREMVTFRDETAKRFGVDLIVHINKEGIERGINPIHSGSALHTQVMKTDARKQAFDLYGFDAAFAGTRRDEEKSRAKARIFSVRSPGHVWDPRDQRPELWNLFNTHIQQGETMGVFPMANWTELDVWEYIMLDRIPVVPLYYAKNRPIVRRNSTLIMVGDERAALVAEREPRTKDDAPEPNCRVPKRENLKKNV